MVTWTNGKVALAQDLVFGLVVMTEHGWHPVEELERHEVQVVINACDFNPSNPYATTLQKILESKEPDTSYDPHNRFGY